MKKKVFRDRYYNIDNLPNEIIVTKTDEGYKVEAKKELIEEVIKKEVKKRKKKSEK